MARIRGYSEEDVDLLVSDFEKVVAASITRAVHTAANNLAAAAVVASSSAGLGPDDISVITAAWDEEVAGALTPYVAEVYTGSAATAAIGLADSFPLDDLPGVPLVPNNFTLSYMNTVSNRLTNVGNELWEEVRTELVDGITLGQSVEQIADRIKHVANVDPVRAARIARTEVHGASEAGSIAQLRYVGYASDQVTKEWLATSDLRTRDTHSLADGQQVTLDERFIVGGASLDFPGDPSGPADEIVNCRCSTAYEVDDPPPFRCDSPFLTAATTAPDAEVCICPLGPDDIAHVSSSARAQIFSAFMDAKISPAWGGAKIQKTIEATRLKIGPELSDLVDDKQMLAVIDSQYVAKKDTFSGKWVTWRQSPAGIKALGPLKPTPTHAKMPVTTATPDVDITPSTPEPQLPTLPPIAPKPGLGEIFNTGKTLGSHGAQVWKNPTTGERWLFKPQSNFMTELDIAMAKLQSKAGLTRPAIYKATLNGKPGSLQFMFDSKSAFPSGAFDPLKLSDEDLLVLQHEQIFDWMISNWDAHTEQFIRLGDGQVYGVDKGQAFKFFGKDKLDWDYFAPGNIGKFVYPAIWKDFVNGKSVNLHDPTKGQLGEYIDRLTAIPDDTYRALLTPYVTEAAKKFGYDGAKLIDGAIARKNSLKADFAAFWQKAVDAREKSAPSTPKPPPVQPPPPPVAPVAPPPPPVPVGGSVTLSYLQKAIVQEKWVSLGGGKKVTPAYGGAKIYKQVQELKTWAKGDSLFETLNDLQLLRLLDETGGFTGKPKTYESVVVDWLKTPASTNTIIKGGKTLDPSLDAKKVATPTVTPPPSPVSPVVPVKALVKDELDDVLMTGEKVDVFGVIDAADHAKIGDAIAYAETNLGVQFRVLKISATVMRIEVRNDQTDKWVTVQTIGTSPYDLKSWTGIDVWKLKPVVVKNSNIPGKGPGDSVTMSELYESRNLWNDGDVIATSVDIDSHGVNIEYRIVSKGDGKATVEFTGLDGSWNDIGVTLGSDENVWNVGNLTKKRWKLTGDVSKKPNVLSSISGKNAGDVVTADDMWFGTTTASPGDTVAYAMDETGHKFRVTFDHIDGAVGIWFKPGLSWTKYIETPTKELFDIQAKKWTWYAAKADGSEPDNFKATDALPKMTKWGIPEDTQMTVEGIINGAGEFGHDMFDVLALGKPITPGGNDLRIYWVDATHIALDKMDPDIGAWEFVHIIDLQDLKAYNVNWFPSTAKAHASSVSGKAATKAAKALSSVAKKPSSKKVMPKKAQMSETPTPLPPAKKLKGDATHIPNYKVGDKVGDQKIFEHYELYDDGQIIAMGIDKKFTGYTITETEMRLVVVNVIGIGKRLMFQKKTKTGTWAGTKIIDTWWDIPHASGGWKASNSFIESKNLPSLHKKVVKAVSPPSPDSPSSAFKKTIFTPELPPKPVSAFSPREVDITPWNQTEQLEMFTHFRNQSVYTNSSPEAVWSALQTTKQFFQVKYGGKYAKLNEIELLRILDEQGAKKHSVANAYPLETKIVQWLKTSEGKAHVNRRIDAPLATKDIPAPRVEFEASKIPHDDQDYQTITTHQAIQYRAESHAKYGGFKVGQKAALKKYTGGVYTSWNKAIRTGKIHAYRNDILNAQAGMRPSTRPMLLHRGTSFSELNDRSITSYETLLPYVGRTYVNRGFNSTSVGGHAAFGGQLLIEYECPIGTPMAYLDDFSNAKGERETLLPTHLVYKILKVFKRNTTTVMRVRVIGAAEV